MNNLIISADDVINITPVRGSVSADYIEPAIERAQDLKLAYVIGYPLTKKLMDIAGGEDDPGDKYANLIKNFVRKYLAWAACNYLLPDIAIKIGAQGVQEGFGAQGNPVFEGTMALIRQNVTNAENSYKKLLLMHLCKDSGKYPEFNEHEQGRQSKKDDSKPFYGVQNY